jgi:signal peptidase I
MAPAVRSGDLLLVDSHLYRARPPERGEIVAWRPPQLEGRLLVKRIVGFPGEMVLYRRGFVWIDGVPLEEPYADCKLDDGAVSYWELGSQEYFLLGDRREESVDCRRLGPANFADILGAVKHRLWPFRPGGLKSAPIFLTHDRRIVHEQGQRQFFE